MTTMQDVAARAGVSAKTVSRVFNDDPHVSPDTRAVVKAAIAELQYVPNMQAVTFRERRSGVVGIAVPDITDPFFAAIVGAIDEVARKQRHTIAVTAIGTDPSDEQPIVEALLRRQMDGFLLVPVGHDQSYLQPWLTRLPIVFIDREPAGVTADCFVEDDQGGAEAAVEHLLARGHERIAFLGDSADVVTTRRRLAGYRDAILKSGRKVESSLEFLVSPDAAAGPMSRLFSQPDPPTAIFSSNSRSSQAIFPAFQQLARSDIALVSFGDFPMASSLQPSVTVIDQNPSLLGRSAAERLFSRLADPDAQYPHMTMLDVHLVERDSTPVRTF